MKKHIDNFKQFIINTIVPYSVLAVIFFLGFIVGQNTMHDKSLQHAVDAGHAIWVGEDGRSSTKGIFMWLDHKHETNVYVR